jgi:hypothetical protein
MQDQLDVERVVESQKASWFQRSLIFWISITMMMRRVAGNYPQREGTV